MGHSQKFFAAALSTLLAAAPLSAGPLAEPKPLIASDQIQAIYSHLIQNHWVPETGLFISFRGTGEHKLEQQASTYEQAAAGMLAVRVGDTERAEAIFHFFKTAWLEGPLKSGREGVSGLANFYNAEFSGEGIEKTIHVGPNAWAGLFAAYLANKTGNKEALAWALDVQRWIAQDVLHAKGGVAMGPIYGSDGTPWPKVFSTENNISYYAFLSELLRAEELEPMTRARLQEERDHVEDWLMTAGFDRLAYMTNRGATPSGTDRTRALDTITWLLSAVGPKRLQERGIDPDRLMRQAEESFLVTLQDRTGVDPTDQPEADLTFGMAGDEIVSHRGGTRPESNHHRMIWYEGLGQYINALTTMSSYWQRAGKPDRAAAYLNKARDLTAQFDLAALKNYPAGAAYPYATAGKFFHDGWFAPPEGVEGPPSSLIAAVWRCFSGLGMDPLAGPDIASVPPVTIPAMQFAKIEHMKPSILYGASEDMVLQAWQYLDHGDTDHAIQQAQATLQEWSPWAIKLSEIKNHKWGHPIEYAGQLEQRKEIFRYWALNDVGAACYILGKAFDQQGHYAQAAGAFQQIALRYPLAQIWDPRGWFWSPLDSIRDEFVSRDPRHYNGVLPPMLVASNALDKFPN